MPSNPTPIELERDAWKALTTSGDAATAFYDEVLADELLMLLPGGLVMEQREEALASMGGQPWDRHELSAMRVLSLGEGGATVAYQATAERQGTRYRAWMSSTYTRVDGRWRLVVHQQTPMEG